MKNAITASSTLNDLEPFITGKSFSGVSSKPRVTVSKELLQNFLTALNQDDIARSFFSAYDSYTDFFETMIDFKTAVPTQLREEVFYSAKNGGIYTSIPAFSVFLLKRAWEHANGIPNLIPYLLPLPAFNNFCKEGYFGGGLTLRDVICNVCTSDYVPLSDRNLKHKMNDFYEVYIPQCNAVAALPNRISESLDDKSIRNITKGKNGLEVNGILLRTMSGYVGAINSTYDLRELI